MSTLAITGIGAVTPYGRGVGPFADALKEGRSAARAATLAPFAEPRPAALLPAELIAGGVEDALSPLTAKNPALGRHLRRAPASLLASALAAVEAYRSAGLIDAGTDGERAGLVVGGQDLGMGFVFTATERFAAGSLISPSVALHMLDTDHVGSLSALLDIHGEGFTAGGASASGGMALVQAARLVRSGAVDRCLVIGALAELSPLALSALDTVGALGGRANAARAERASRPFDAGSDGFIYAQAAGAMVLENAAAAKARGATILAALLGAGACLDGTPLPTPSVDGEVRSMQLALKDAGLAPEAIDLVNAHGTASRIGDETELDAIARVFGDRTRIQSTKSLLGHGLWAAGVIESVAVVAQMRGGFVHGNLNLEQPIRSDLALMGQAATSPGPSIVMKNSFGFGGINTSVVIARHLEEESI